MNQRKTNYLDLFRRQEGKTLTFWATEKTRNMNWTTDLCTELMMEAGEQNARVCFHESPDAPFHEMLIYERGGHYFPPHRHLIKPELITRLYGTLTFVTFEEDGTPTYCKTIQTGASLFRANPNQYHFINVISNYALYYEVKPGPFLGDADREFAPWAPKVSDAVGIDIWMRDLLKR